MKQYSSSKYAIPLEVSDSLLQHALTATEDARFHREQIKADIDFFNDLDDNHEYLEEVFVKTYEPYVMTQYSQRAIRMTINEQGVNRIY